MTRLTRSSTTVLEEGTHTIHPLLRRGLAALWACTAIVTMSLGVLPGDSRASSHSEAPGTVRDRLADDTDVYAFVSRDAEHAVTFVGLWIPLLEPNGGPNFYAFDEEASYYINIDNMGDCIGHLRYRFEFTTTRRTGGTFLYNTGPVTSLDDPDLNVRQTYRVTRIVDGVETVLATDLPVAPNRVGPASMPDYASLARDAVVTLPDGTKLFAGPRDDPFFADLAAIFDLLTIRRPPGNEGRGVDGLAGFDAMAIVMQVPFERLTRDGLAPTETTATLGIYDSVERPQNRILNGDGTVTTSGPDVQVSRLGMPLVNELVIPLGDKDKFNASKPVDDAQFLASVTHPELPALLQLLYGIQVPPVPRSDLVTVFLTGVPGLNQVPGGAACDMLRLNMLVPPSRKPKRLAVLRGDLAGFPNGRRLADDVVDIAERVAAGVLVPGFDIKPNRQLGDGVDCNDVPFLPYFPYLALPHDPLDHDHAGDEQDDDKSQLVPGDDPASGDDPESEEHEDDAAGGIGPGRGGAEPVGSGPPELRIGPGRSRILELSVPRAAHVTLSVYDARGRRVRTLVDQDAAAGSFAARWDGRDAAGQRLGSGVYFARYELDGRVIESHKLLLVR